MTPANDRRPKIKARWLASVLNEAVKLQDQPMPWVRLKTASSSSARPETAQHPDTRVRA